MESTSVARPSVPPAAPAFTALWYPDLALAGPETAPWLWHGYLASGQVTLLTSQWKLGKSTLLAALLARMKTGGELAGMAVRPGKAIVISEESPAKWYERGQQLSFGDHLCWFCRPFLGSPRLAEWQALIDQVIDLHNRHGLALVVIDPLANLSPLKSENDAGEMLRTLLPLQRLTAQGVSVLLLHHPRKGAVVPGQAARGSGALCGYVDIIIEMQRVTKSRHDRRRRLQSYSRHDATPPSWVIELSDDGSEYRVLGVSAEPHYEQAWPILKSLFLEADGPLKRADIWNAWPADQVRPAKQTLWRWLQRAIKEQALKTNGLGTRNDPITYELRDMWRVWHHQLLEKFVPKPSPEETEQVRQYREHVQQMGEELKQAGLIGS